MGARLARGKDLRPYQKPPRPQNAARQIAPPWMTNPAARSGDLAFRFRAAAWSSGVDRVPVSPPRTAVAIVLAVALGAVANALAYRADQKKPPRKEGG
jgi:hypothetical protein